MKIEDLTEEQKMDLILKSKDAQIFMACKNMFGSYQAKFIELDDGTITVECVNPFSNSEDK